MPEPERHDPDIVAQGDIGATQSMAPPDSESTVIGRYRLLQKIGEGGMGEVWLAEQTEPMRRRVALKLVKGGMNTREVIARFESERQALALMDHPTIAKVFDAGSTPEGAPYFVMEYVAGSPITTYCDTHRLSTRERLELFMRVCDGVQHAHQKAIIHRDLKPSNILVTELDGKAAPKIIDFGVAKALTQKLTADTIFTRLGVMIGTPQYASPEQALSQGEDVDTRSDVYSLGIILYELLAGAPPLEPHKIAFDEFLRKLREEDPPKPSTRIRASDPNTSTEIARKRQTEPQALARQLRGDLDWIVLKALEKMRTRRYGSAADLGSDIGRYLNNEVVLATPPSAAYRFRKFAIKRRLPLAFAAALATVLAGAAVFSAREAVRARRAEQVSQAVNDFLRDDLLAQASARGQSGSGGRADSEIKVRTALDRAAQTVGGKFSGQPEVEAAIRETIAQTYKELGLYPQAHQQAERVLELLKATIGPNDRRTLSAQCTLAGIEYQQAKFPEVEARLTAVVAAQRRLFGPTDSDTLDSMETLAGALADQQKFPQAESLLKEIYNARWRKDPASAGGVRAAMNLAAVYSAEGKNADAETVDVQALEAGRRALGEEHPDMLATANNLGEVYRLEGKYAEAEAIQTRALELERHAYGPEHPETLKTMGNLASAYLFMGKYSEAEPLYRKIIEIDGPTLGPLHPATLTATHNLAMTCYLQSRIAEAVVLSEKVVEARKRTIGPEHLDTLISSNLLATEYSMLGRLPEAEALVSNALAIERRTIGPKHPETLRTMGRLGAIYRQQSKFAESEKIQGEAYAILPAAVGPEHPSTLTAACNLAFCRHMLHRDSEAEDLMRSTLAVYDRKYPDDWQRFRCQALLGASLAGQGKFADAEPLLVGGHQGMLDRRAKIQPDSLANLTWVRKWIAEMYERWGKPDKAREWRTKTSL